ncbi:MAG: PAS domain S-box protein [Acidimicrobiales bacterium]
MTNDEATMVAPPTGGGERRSGGATKELIDEARRFDLADLFFSTTDGRGIIASGNEVFCRVSGMTEEELIGKPHSIVRHPDTPRAVFRLLWNYLEDNRPVVAYVKNLASDGRYYWVLAAAFPVGEGYLSIRLKPTSPLATAVADIYREVRAFEVERERRGERRSDVVSQSERMLLSAIAGAGFATYEEFMRAALASEIRLRREAMQRAPTAPPDLDAHDPLFSLLEPARQLGVWLDGRFAGLDDLAEMDQQLSSRSAYLLSLAEDIRVFAFNAVLAASQMNEDGEALTSVASELQSRCSVVIDTIEKLADEIRSATTTINSLSFRTAMTALQCEVFEFFCIETMLGAGVGGGRVDTVLHDLSSLHAGMRRGLELLVERAQSHEQHLQDLRHSIYDLQSGLASLSRLVLSGRIESARLRDGSSFVSLFNEVGDQIKAAKREVNLFRDVATSGHPIDGAEIDGARSSLASIDERLASVV